MSEKKWEDSKGDKTKLYMSYKAYAKIAELVFNFDSEIGWNCFCRRADDGSGFVIEDVVMCKQHVTNSHVETDQIEYIEFMNGLSNDEFNSMKGMGHSHWKFDPHPSGEDRRVWGNITDQLNGDMYYIFQIFNQRNQVYSEIYDAGNGIKYSCEDIEIVRGNEHDNINLLLENAKDLVIYHNSMEEVNLK